MKNKEDILRKYRILNEKHETLRKDQDKTMAVNQKLTVKLKNVQNVLQTTMDEKMRTEHKVNQFRTRTKCVNIS